MTSGILFDFHGVIVDDEAQHRDALIGWPHDEQAITHEASELAWAHVRV